MVNDTLVQNVETLPGGIVSYTLDGVLSNYQQRVHEAFVELSKVSPPLWPFGKVKGVRARNKHPHLDGEREREREYLTVFDIFRREREEKER